MHIYDESKSYNIQRECRKAFKQSLTYGKKKATKTPHSPAQTSIKV